MKVRIGIAPTATESAAHFAETVDRAEALGIDSLWLSEVVFGPSVEPFIGMGYALSRTARLKVGTGVAILPGRHPVLVAKQLVSLAALAPAGYCPPSASTRPGSAREVPSPSRETPAAPSSTSRWSCSGCCSGRRA